MSNPTPRWSASLWGGVAVIGAAAILSAPFLPWVTGSSPLLGTASLTGFEAGRGIPVAIAAGALGLVAGSLMIVGVTSRRSVVVLGTLSATIAAIVAWMGYRDAADPVVSFLYPRDDSPVVYAAAAGVWLMFLGAGSLAVASLAYGLLRAPTRGPVTPDAQEESSP